MEKINDDFSLQLQLAEKDKEINGLTSRLENLSREKVLNSVLKKSFRGVWVAQLFMRLVLCFSSGHSSRVVRSGAVCGTLLSAQRLLDILAPPPACARGHTPPNK